MDLIRAIMLLLFFKTQSNSVDNGPHHNKGDFCLRMH